MYALLVLCHSAGRTKKFDSLFTYGADESHADFNDDTGYTPLFGIDPDSVPANVKSTCGNNTECIFDYALTGSMEFAMSTVSEVEEQKKVRKTESKLVSQCITC